MKCLKGIVLAFVCLAAMQLCTDSVCAKKKQIKKYTVNVSGGEEYKPKTIIKNISDRESSAAWTAALKSRKMDWSWKGNKVKLKTASVRLKVGKTGKLTGKKGNKRIVILVKAVQNAGERTKAVRDVKVTSDTFPDAAFREFVTQQYDENQDGILNKDEIKKVTSIEIRGASYASLAEQQCAAQVESLQGIEYLCNAWRISLINLPKAVKLDLSNISAKDVWVSDCESLTQIVFGRNLAVWDVGLEGNTNLVSCDFNNLKELQRLRMIDCGFKDITISNDKLWELRCYHNSNLQNLRFSYKKRNTSLLYMMVGDIKSKKLDVSRLKKLAKIECWGLGKMIYHNRKQVIDVDVACTDGKNIKRSYRH